MRRASHAIGGGSPYEASDAGSGQELEKRFVIETEKMAADQQQQRRDLLLGETSPHKSDPQVDSIEPGPGRPFFGIQTPSNIVARRF